MSLQRMDAPPANDDGDAITRESLSAILSQDGRRSRDRLTAEPYAEWSDDPGRLLSIAATYRWDGLRGTFAALTYLEAAEREIRSLEDPPARLLASAALLRASINRTRGQIDDALRHAQDVIDALTSPAASIADRLDMSAVALLTRGATRVFAGRLLEARQDLRAGLLADDGRTPLPEQIEAQGFIALVDVLSGSLHAAEHTLAAVEAVTSELPPGLWTAPASVAALLLASERGELSANADAVRELVGLVEGSEFEFFGLHLLVLLRQECGEWDEALEGIRLLREIEVSSPGAELLRLLRCSDRIDVHFALGDLAPARQALEHEADPQHLLCVDAARARLSLLLGDFEAAAAHTRECLAAGEDHPARSWLYAIVLDACAHWALGDMCTAERSFRAALRQAVSTGARRAFLSAPPRALQALVGGGGHDSDLSPAERKALTDIAALTRPVAGTDIDLLSPRERIVLMHLAAGESPREVAVSLRVSLNTIKTQLRSVYRKLGASTRAGAVERARTLGVLAA